MQNSQIEVYRIEHPKDGVGPYGPKVAIEDGDLRNVRNWISMQHCDRTTHPTPSQDLLSYRLDSEFCAFEDINQLRIWFSDTELKRLVDAGFEVKIYSAPPETVRKGSKQVLFKRETASLVRKLTQKELNEL